jgi:hypothetical protein
MRGRGGRCVALEGDVVASCSTDGAVGEQMKYTTALREHTTTMTHMQRELESLRSSEQAFRTKLRDMELDNDDLEKSERCVLSILVRETILIFEMLLAGRRTRRCKTSRIDTAGLLNGQHFSRKSW